jgi:hypothetical protein
MKHKIKLLLVILQILVLFDVSKGMAMAEDANYKAEIQKKFKQLDLSVGVNEAAAVIIAQNHLIEQGLDKKYNLLKPKIEDENTADLNDWKVIFNATYGESVKKANIFGLIGVMKWWVSVRVDKNTGKIISEGGPDL